VISYEKGEGSKHTRQIHKKMLSIPETCHSAASAYALWNQTPSLEKHCWRLLASSQLLLCFCFPSPKGGYKKPNRGEGHLSTCHIEQVRQKSTRITFDTPNTSTTSRNKALFLIPSRNHINRMKYNRSANRYFGILTFKSR
jgi:hypothetical protein